MLLTFGSIKRKTKTLYNAIGEEAKSPMTAVCGEAMWILHLQRSLAVVQSVLPRVYDRPLLCWRRIVCSFFSTIWMVPIKTRVALWDQDRKAYFLHLSFAFRYRCALSAIETLSALCLCARWKVLIVFPVMQRFLSWFSEKSNLKGVSVVLKWSLVTYAAVNWYTLTQRGMPYFCI